MGTGCILGDEDDLKLVVAITIQPCESMNPLNYALEMGDS